VGSASEGTSEIVKGVDFIVKNGEVLALMGASGSGRTTLARVVGWF
jgi:peptide/nickel transport system ATP-binding protein